MRLTALCVCGTLLAFSSLSWTTEGSGEDLLGDKGFGPCVASLQLDGPCSQGQEENTCPYLLSLPPLTVHLPPQLRELEKIMKDLQSLKDNVDQLREMCADCKVSQTERECVTQSEREHVKLNEGTEIDVDGRNWVNEQNPDGPKDAIFGRDRVKVERSMEGDGDTEKRPILEGRGREKWEADRESNKGVVKENEKAETFLKVTEKDGKTLTEAASVTYKLGQAKMPTAGGNRETEAKAREKIVEKNNRETERNKESGQKEDSRGDRGDILESRKERKLTTDEKNMAAEKEDSDQHSREDTQRETDRRTQTGKDRGSDGIKMSEDHDEHTNKKREQHWRDRTKKLEKRVKVKQNDETPKQIESTGHTQEVGVEDEEVGEEIKTGEKGVPIAQGQSEGDLVSNKVIERTDLVSVSQNPQSSSAPRDNNTDSNKATTLTSSPPSCLPFNSRLIWSINQATAIAAHRPTTHGTDTDLSDISDHPHPDVDTGYRTTSRPTTMIRSLVFPGHQVNSVTTRPTSTTRPRPEAGYYGRVSSTVATTTNSTTSQNLYTTTVTGVRGHTHWTAKKNFSSNMKTGVRPQPGQGTKPGEKHKQGIRPEADRKQNNLKNDPKPERATLPVKKSKQDQKQRPSLQKPAAEQKPKPGKDPRQVHISKPTQRAPFDNFTSDQNLKNNSIPKSATANATGSELEPLRDQLSSRLEKIPDRLSQTGKADLNSKEKTNPDLRTDSIHHFTPVQGKVIELMEHSVENPSPEPKANQESQPGQNLFLDRFHTLTNQKPKHTQKIPVIKQKTDPGKIPKPYQRRPEPDTGKKTKPNVKPKPDQAKPKNPILKTPNLRQIPKSTPQSVPAVIPETQSNPTPKQRHLPRYRPTQWPGATSEPDVFLKSSPKTITDLDPQISGTTSDGVQNSQADMSPKYSKQSAEMKHSPADTEFSPSTKESITPGPKTFNSLDTGPFPLLHTLSQGVTVTPNSRITSDLGPQTAGQPSSIPMTTRPNNMIHGIRPSVIPSTSPGSTGLKLDLNTDSRLQAMILDNVEETPPQHNPYSEKMIIPVPSPSSQTTSTPSPDIRSTTQATFDPEAPAMESSTPSARELRVKINQVPAFPDARQSSSGRSQGMRPKEPTEDNQGRTRTDLKLPRWITSKDSAVRRDCSDHLIREGTKSGVYPVTPDPRGGSSFSVPCDMELTGGGWTLLQRRQDGSVSFNRTWVEYREGFGDVDGGEFWLGNTLIHLLTRDRDMTLRAELEDFDGVREYAEYQQFRVASERLRFRLTVGGYSGTAGDALRFSKSYDHNNRPFTTPDRDNDRYPSGNCGAYYSSGWWFNACMAANLNGRYYFGKYTGLRDGIFWGTWHNISTEYYPTNERRSFKTVRMMIRPKGFAP